jgi:hypothetical protein
VSLWPTLIAMLRLLIFHAAMLQAHEVGDAQWPPRGRIATVRGSNRMHRYAILYRLV